MINFYNRQPVSIFLKVVKELCFKSEQQINIKNKNNKYYIQHQLPPPKVIHNVGTLLYHTNFMPKEFRSYS